jgi:hypothetical protein
VVGLLFLQGAGCQPYQKEERKEERKKKEERKIEVVYYRFSASAPNILTSVIIKNQCYFNGLYIFVYAEKTA